MLPSVGPETLNLLKISAVYTIPAFALDNRDLDGRASKFFTKHGCGDQEINCSIYFLCIYGPMDASFCLSCYVMGDTRREQFVLLVTGGASTIRPDESVRDKADFLDTKSLAKV